MSQATNHIGLHPQVFNQVNRNRSRQNYKPAKTGSGAKYPAQNGFTLNYFVGYLPFVQIVMLCLELSNMFLDCLRIMADNIIDHTLD